MVEYEWDCEVVAADGDIEDHWFATSFKAAKADVPKVPEQHPGCKGVLVLVRDSTDDDRCWAYVGADGKLPEYFEDAFQRPTHLVPKRFHIEVAKAS